MTHSIVGKSALTSLANWLSSSCDLFSAPIRGALGSVEILEGVFLKVKQDLRAFMTEF